MSLKTYQNPEQPPSTSSSSISADPSSYCIQFFGVNQRCGHGCTFMLDIYHTDICTTRRTDEAVDVDEVSCEHKMAEIIFYETGLPCHIRHKMDRLGLKDSETWKPQAPGLNPAQPAKPTPSTGGWLFEKVASPSLAHPQHHLTEIKGSEWLIRSWGKNCVDYYAWLWNFNPTSRSTKPVRTSGYLNETFEKYANYDYEFTLPPHYLAWDGENEGPVIMSVRGDPKAVGWGNDAEEVTDPEVCRQIWGSLIEYESEPE
ncbi:hypothetical protein M422DRAFT_70478 [Sphaerobolus stellatus SS14]|uniref:Uncharacterized protein n=1 Tax=Sphaerobolus stellatus (strain SS14) TaxID=990650 RepID=A0A0C9V6T1_SPHS4|nr:hypothetical protein M422DRAFT_70478 [Sphaerobolus stellatus SS14]